MLIEFDDRFTGRLQICRGREVDFVEDQHIRILNLCLIERAKHLAQTGELWNVDYCHHRPHLVAAPHGFIRKRLDHLFRFSDPCGLDNADVDILLVVQFLDRVDQGALQGATQAPGR